MEDKTLVRRFIAPADEWIFKREECVGEAASSKNVISVFRNTGSKQLFGGIARNGTLSRVKNWPTECVDGNGVRIKGGPGAVLTSLLDNHRLIQLAPDALTFEVPLSLKAHQVCKHFFKFKSLCPILIFHVDRCGSVLTGRPYREGAKWTRFGHFFSSDRQMRSRRRPWSRPATRRLGIGMSQLDGWGGTKILRILIS